MRGILDGAGWIFLQRSLDESSTLNHFQMRNEVMVAISVETSDGFKVRRLQRIVISYNAHQHE